MSDLNNSAAETPADALLAIPVWDLPTRVFHWALVLLIAFSWWSAENEQVQWHIWSGFAVLFLVLFRILWGFLGSSTARFAGFVRGPRGVIDYLHRARDWKAIGHTPLGGLSVIALLVLIGAQVTFGLLLSDEDGIVTAPLNRFVDLETADLAHEVHEALFNVLLGFIVLHVAAIVFYRLFRGRKLLGPMIGGSAKLQPGTAPMARATAGRLILSLAVAGALTGWIVAGLPPLGS